MTDYTVVPSSQMPTSISTPNAQPARMTNNTSIKSPYTQVNAQYHATPKHNKEPQRHTRFCRPEQRTAEHQSIPRLLPPMACNAPGTAFSFRMAAHTYRQMSNVPLSVCGCAPSAPFPNACAPYDHTLQPRR